MPLINEKLKEIRECNNKIQDYCNKQIKLIDNVKELIKEYKKLKFDHSTD